MLDTNTCIYAIKQQPPKLIQRFKDFQVGELAISSIVYSELMYGIYNSDRIEYNLEKLNHFLNAIVIVDYDENVADFYGQIRTKLKKSGTPIGSNDLFIAAHALERKLPLVTNNQKEFSRVNSLKLENWIA